VVEHTKRYDEVTKTAMGLENELAGVQKENEGRSSELKTSEVCGFTKSGTIL